MSAECKQREMITQSVDTYPAYLKQLHTDIVSYHLQSKPSETKSKQMNYLKIFIEFHIKLIEKHYTTNPHEYMDNICTVSNKHIMPWDIFKYGSASLGISTATSDVDLGISTHEHVPKQSLLRTISALIKQEAPHYYLKLQIEDRIQARYPVISITDQHGNNIDISFADEYCLPTDIFMKDVLDHYQSEFDIAIREFIVFIKLWSKRRGVNGASKGRLSSFGYCLLVMKFMDWYCYKSSKWDKTAKVSIGVLAAEFFKFYGTVWNPNTHAIHVTDRSNAIIGDTFGVKRTGHDIEITDPCNSDNNIARGVKRFGCKVIKQEIIRALNIITEFKDKPLMSETSLFEMLTEKMKNCCGQYRDFKCQYDGWDKYKFYCLECIAKENNTILWSGVNTEAKEEKQRYLLACAERLERQYHVLENKISKTPSYNIWTLKRLQILKDETKQQEIEINKMIKI